MESDERKVEELLRLYSGVIRELKAYKVIRTNNVVGEYAEWLVSKRMNLTLAPPSEKGYDASSRDESGREIRYQIKSRWDSESEADGAYSGRRILGDIRSYGMAEFDFLVVLFFSQCLEVQEAYMFPYELVEEYGHWQEAKKAYRVVLNQSLIQDKRVTNLANIFL